MHACAVLADGTAQCWGGNVNGALGDGTETNRLSPAVVSGLSNADSIECGESHTCAHLANDTIQCWGNNQSGQLGNGESIYELTPVGVM